MAWDKVPYAYGNDRSQDWWAAPIDFTNHKDTSGRTVNNVNRHYPFDVEILRTPISGATAEDKIYALAQVAIENEDSLNTLPVRQ